MCEANPRMRYRAQSGATNWRGLSLLAGAIIVLAVAVLLFYPRPVPQPPVEPTETPLAPAEAPSPVSKQARPDSAREVIAELQEGEGPVDYAQAHARAREFQADGRLADAQLLYFFAARGGYAPAAFDLAQMYDPNHYTPESSLMDKPDPFQAYKLYRQAQDAGHENAGQRLAELHAWAEQAASAGDMDAERLLVTWE